MLEKILEEIEERIRQFKENLRMEDVDICYGLNIAKKIIRQHMNDGGNEIAETCPHCDNELTVKWDVEKDGYEIFCPYCGFPIMLCSMCDARDGKPCDWDEGVGCKYSDERYRDFFRKKDNDGWIPVEERLPKDGKYIILSLSNFSLPMIGRYDRDEEGAGAFYLGDCDGQDTCISNDLYVNAWQPFPEPYRPEKGGNDGDDNL